MSLIELWVNVSYFSHFRDQPGSLPTAGETDTLSPTGGGSNLGLTHCMLQVLLVRSVVDALRICNLMDPTFLQRTAVSQRVEDPGFSGQRCRFIANDTTV